MNSNMNSNRTHCTGRERGRENERERSTPEGLDMPFRVGLREGSWCAGTHGPYLSQGENNEEELLL
jgi:hypothetical protein